MNSFQKIVISANHCLSRPIIPPVLSTANFYRPQAAPTPHQHRELMGTATWGLAARNGNGPSPTNASSSAHNSWGGRAAKAAGRQRLEGGGGDRSDSNGYRRGRGPAMRRTTPHLCRQPRWPWQTSGPGGGPPRRGRPPAPAPPGRAAGCCSSPPAAAPTARWAAGLRGGGRGEQAVIRNA